MGVPVESIEAVEKKPPPAEVGVLTVRVPDEYSNWEIGCKKSPAVNGLCGWKLSTKRVLFVASWMS